MVPCLPGEGGCQESFGRTSPSSPRKRGPRSKRLKSLGSRFRGNDEKRARGPHRGTGLRRRRPGSVPALGTGLPPGRHGQIRGSTWNSASFTRSDFVGSEQRRAKLNTGCRRPEEAGALSLVEEQGDGRKSARAGGGRCVARRAVRRRRGC